MCGHVFIYNKKLPPNDELIRRLTEKINYREEENTSYYIKDNVSFGFKKPSIVDLENPKQVFNKQNYSIVFNGKLYNQREIINSLKHCNHNFETNSDIEALLTYYIEKRESCVNNLRGMFTFIIYDEKKKEVFGARDHFGIKPLYYLEDKEYIAFASEYKALVDLIENVNIDDKSLQNYLSFQYVPRDKTIIKEIKKVPKGTYFTIKNGILKFINYYNPCFIIKKQINKNDVYNVISESVEKHMKSNVDVGTFLSGGIDSTIIATLASKINPNIKSFSVGFDVPGYNEIDVAKKTADKLNIENIQINVTQEDYIRSLPSVVYSLDDPLADPSCVGLYHLSKKASKYVNIALSGEGSDELFGGYNIYKEYNSIKPFLLFPNSINNKMNKIFSAMPNLKGKNYLLRATTKLSDRYIGNAKIFENHEVKNIIFNYDDNNKYSDILRILYKDSYSKGYDYVTTMQNIDVNTWLEGDILLKAYKMSMAHSLEVRVPFLDMEVLKVSKNLTLSQKISRKNTKILLREAFKDTIPEHIVEKKKLGFPTPIRVWLKDDLGEFVRKVILECETDIINKKYAINLLDEHIKGRVDNSRKIWTIFMFALWHQVFVENMYINPKDFDLVI